MRAALLIFVLSLTIYGESVLADKMTEHEEKLKTALDACTVGLGNKGTW